jgi:hypothetical protein
MASIIEKNGGFATSQKLLPLIPQKDILEKDF